MNKSVSENRNACGLARKDMVQPNGRRKCGLYMPDS